MNSIVRQAMRHVAVRGLDPARVEELANQLWRTVLDEQDGFRAGALARKIATAMSTPAKRRFTLSDLADNRTLAEWLNYDGNPPIVDVFKASRHIYGMGRHGKSETKPVCDAPTAAQWWDEYRKSLRADWDKSAENPYKPRTHTQFLAECLSSIGIKGGTVEERKARAKQLHPELYSDSPIP